ncbi:uncharacterized protein K441DRAFT_70697 [Cenococcum geophilum 1.58]|uniref:uncharacterized protein n=1 Tax=Cenococcum geophilum 1.58 TaxID=794803 RepID=UPI0035900780|nr:hypothetical protein K441DRAFT_70697 [Cenococcum geophilum 1.58]
MERAQERRLEEMDAIWMKKLNHRFGDDGEFWMLYDGLRSKFDILDRTRLFDHEWTVVQQWTGVNVSWVTGYLNTKFQARSRRSTNATSKASRASILSTCTSCSKKRGPKPATTSCGRAAPGSATASSAPRSISSRAATGCCQRLRRPRIPLSRRSGIWLRSEQKGICRS